MNPFLENFSLFLAERESKNIDAEARVLGDPHVTSTLDLSMKHLQAAHKKLSGLLNESGMLGIYKLVLVNTLAHLEEVQRLRRIELTEKGDKE